MNILSEEMEKEIKLIIDKRLLDLTVLEDIKFLGETRTAEFSELEINVQNNKDAISDIEFSLEELKIQFENLEMETPTSEQIVKRFTPLEEFIEQLNNSNFVKHIELEQLVAETMLKLMPNFNLKLSKEMKKHFVVIAKYVIKHFKEEE